MMENGTSRLVLEQMADNENNLVILTGYCMAVSKERNRYKHQGTIARQLREGEHIIPLLNGNAGETVNVRCTIKTISFSAHSDFPGTSSFIKDTQPDYVVLVHGEASRMEDLKEGLLNTMQSYVKFNDVRSMNESSYRYIVQEMQMNCVLTLRHLSILRLLVMLL